MTRHCPFPFPFWANAETETNIKPRAKTTKVRREFDM
jgi:hypothetical protein